MRRAVLSPPRDFCYDSAVVVSPEPVPSAPPSRSGETAPAAVEVIALSRRFGPVLALDRVSLRVGRGEYFALLGPSGCGKTTLLRLLAGLDAPDAGEIRLDGRPATDLPAHRRPVNTVFQSYALFPHLTVWDNVAFGLRMKRVPAAELKRRVAQALELTQIRDLADRHPARLSGGQKQRVALARAVVNEPAVLLLDEPLGALDLALRRQLQGELKALQRRLGITFIHVTHDQEEALALSDRVGVLRAGRLEQVGPPRALYERPRNRFVAEFLGACNLLPARRTDGGPAGQNTWETSIGPLRLAKSAPMPDRAQVTLAIRPEKIQLHRVGSAAVSRAESDLPGRVTDVVFAGAETHCQVEVRGQTLRVHVPNVHPGEVPLRPGEAVTLRLPPDALFALED